MSWWKQSDPYMKPFCYLILTTFLFSQCGMKMLCQNFNEGTFLISGNSEVPSSKSVRTKNRITEYLDENVWVSTVEYIDDCTYRTFFNLEESTLNLFYQQMSLKINESGGILFETDSIQGDTVFYRSIITMDSLVYEYPGSMIKLSDTTAIQP